MESSRTAAMLHSETAGMGSDMDGASAHAQSNPLTNFLRVQGYKYSGSLASLRSSAGASQEVSAR